MQTSFDRVKLREIVSCIYHVTGINFSVFDCEFRLIAGYSPSMCDFCTEVRRCPSLAARCHASDKTALEECRRRGTLYSYRCHMGLTEVATPILYHHTVIGYMLFGQIMTDTDRASFCTAVRRIAEKEGIDAEKLLGSVDRIRYCSEDMVQALAHLARMAAENIWMQGIIRVQRIGLANSIETYIETHLGETIAVTDLCRTFCVSRTALFTLAKEQYGMSITAYIATRRMEEAKRQLREGRRVKDVAAGLGFSDITYFSRFFKKHAGLSPKVYQSENRCVEYN